MIKYINKKYAAISVALSLLPSVLTGCTANGFKYKENSNNEIVVEGTISYNQLKNCYYVEIENPDYDKMEYYISKKERTYRSDLYLYIDLFIGKKIFEKCEDDYYKNKTSRFLKIEDKLEDYLLSENFIKESYTIDDVNKILDEMKKIEENKKLVK